MNTEQNTPKMTFNELIAKNKPVLVDFYAEWCGPCKIMKPILDELKTRLGEKVHIIKIDVDKSPQAAAAYRIQGVPTLILFKNNTIKWRESGVLQTNELEKIIQGFL